MSTNVESKSAHKAGAFDIRTFIAALIGIYGVVLVLMGIFSTSEEDLAKADGLNVNLWAGIGMIVAAVLFQAWAMLRPVVVPDDPAELDTDDEADGETGSGTAPDADSREDGDGRSPSAH